MVVSTPFEFRVPPVGPNPIVSVGIHSGAESGLLRLDSLGWKGSPVVEICKGEGSVWRSQWINAMDDLDTWGGNAINACHSDGDGLLLYGSRDWTDYTVESTLQIYLATHAGVAVRVQGLRRFVALVVVNSGVAQIIERVDDRVSILAEMPFDFEFGEDIKFSFKVSGDSVVGWINGVEIASTRPVSLSSGAIGLVVSEGRIKTSRVSIS